jgi:hypothetical protein
MGMAKNAPMSAVKGVTAMTKFGLIGAAALSLMLATPATASHWHHHYGYFHTLKHFGSTYAAYNFYYRYDFARRNTFN